MSDNDVEHFGSCHCGSVKWRVVGPRILTCFKCNCSICNKKQNHHFIVSKNRFTLLQGEDMITNYSFNTGVAKHTFCKKCGVQSFYYPRSNPGDIGIMPHCIDSPTVEKVEFMGFDGQNWEKEVVEKAPKAY